MARMKPSSRRRGGNRSAAAGNHSGESRDQTPQRPLWVRILALVTLAGLLATLVITRWPEPRVPSAIALEAEKSPPELAVLLREIDDVSGTLVQRYPDDPAALDVLARAHYRLGMMKKAERFWQQCLELNSNFISAVHSLAMLHQEQGNNEKAASYFRRALDSAPDSPVFSVELSQVLLAEGKVNEAIEVLEKDVELHPRALGTLAMLGQAYLEDRQYAQAKHYLERAIEVGPTYSGAYNGLVSACANLGEEEAAKEYAEKLRELKVQEADAHRGRLKEHDDVGRTKAMVGEIHWKASSVYLTQNEPELAEQHLLRAIENAPESRKAYEGLAWLYHRQGRTQEAAEILDELLAIVPDDAAAQLNCARLCAQLGRFEEAEAAYQKAIELAPEQPGGYAALAWLYIDHEKKLSEIKELAEKAIEREPLAKYYYLLGVTCQINEDAKGAREAIARAVSLDPRNPEYRRVWQILQPSTSARPESAG